MNSVTGINIRSALTIPLGNDVNVNVDVPFTFIDFVSLFVTRVGDFADIVQDTFFSRPPLHGPLQASYDALVSANTALVVYILERRHDLGLHTVSWILSDTASQWTGNVPDADEFPRVHGASHPSSIRGIPNRVEDHMAVGREVRARLAVLDGTFLNVAEAEETMGAFVTTNHNNVLQWLQGNGLNVNAMRQRIHGVAYTPLLRLQQAHANFQDALHPISTQTMEHLLTVRWWTEDNVQLIVNANDALQGIGIVNVEQRARVLASDGFWAAVRRNDGDAEQAVGDANDALLNINMTAVEACSGASQRWVLGGRRSQRRRR